MKENIEKYLNQDLSNPKYLFYGSSNIIDKLEPIKQKTVFNNKVENIVLTSYFVNAAAYAFKDKLKECNTKYSFKIDNDDKDIVMEYSVENIPIQLKSYIYVFEKTNDIMKKKGKNTTQYISYNCLEPIDFIEIDFDDFKKYFKRIEK